MKMLPARWFYYVLITGTLSAAIVFAEQRQAARNCGRINVSIANELGNYFVNEADVTGLVTDNGAEPLVGHAVRNIDFKRLELRLKTNKFVRECEVSRNLRGEVRVFIRQAIPLARVTQADAPDAYVSRTGEVLPMSERYTARVLLVRGEAATKLLGAHFLETEAGKPYLELLQAIDQNPFWRAQLSEMAIDRQGEITFYPQVGGQVIEFGSPTDLPAKWEKLRLFYKKIIPAKGWNRYRRLNIKYQNQIICE